MPGHNPDRGQDHEPDEPPDDQPKTAIPAPASQSTRTAPAAFEGQPWGWGSRALHVAPSRFRSYFADAETPRNLPASHHPGVGSPTANQRGQNVQRERRRGQAGL